MQRVIDMPLSTFETIVLHGLYLTTGLPLTGEDYAALVRYARTIQERRDTLERVRYSHEREWREAMELGSEEEEMME